MSPVAIATAVASIIVDLVADRLTPAQTARRLVDTALATGVPENELASYLTAAARERQEMAFRAAKAAKLR